MICEWTRIFYLFGVSMNRKNNREEIHSVRFHELEKQLRGDPESCFQRSAGKMHNHVPYR